MHFMFLNCFVLLSFHFFLYCSCRRYFFALIGFAVYILYYSKSQSASSNLSCCSAICCKLPLPLILFVQQNVKDSHPPNLDWTSCKVEEENLKPRFMVFFSSALLFQGISQFGTLKYSFSVGRWHDGCTYKLAYCGNKFPNFREINYSFSGLFPT